MARLRGERERDRGRKTRDLATRDTESSRLSRVGLDVGRDLSVDGLGIRFVSLQAPRYRETGSKGLLGYQPWTK